MKKPLPPVRKELGQNYLRDQNVILKIVHSLGDENSSRSNALIEIGPGPAVLTAPLRAYLPPETPLYVIERDERFQEYLFDVIKDESHIIFADALEYDLKNILEKHSSWSLVSNLPYNISIPLILKFLKEEKIEFMTLMMQKEVGDKILGNHDKNAMNPLLAITSLFMDRKKLMLVPPGAFAPPPEVDSIVLTFKRLKEPLIPLSDFKKFESFSRLFFNMKRKQLGKVLKSQFNLKAEEAKEICQKVGVEATLRAETLTINQVISFYHACGNLGHIE